MRTAAGQTDADADVQRALKRVDGVRVQVAAQALQALFDNADDTLFEMADRATSNAEQNAFFEAMRDLRLKRKNIERGFRSTLYGFTAIAIFMIFYYRVFGLISVAALSVPTPTVARLGGSVTHSSRVFR